MATLMLKDCKEFMVFNALTESGRFLDACKMLMEFGKTRPNEKVLKKQEDKKILRVCFEECQRAIAIAFPRGEQPDFSNVSHLNRLKNVFNQQLPRHCQKPRDDFSSTTSGKLGMGKIFLEHMDYISVAGLSYYKSLIREEKREAEKIVHEQVRVDSYRPLERGYDNGQVLSGKKEYKTQQEVIWERMAEERKKGLV